MIHPRLIILEPDGRLARHLRPWQAASRVVVREFRHTEACFTALTETPHAVLLVLLGDEAVNDLTFVARVRDRWPDLRTAVVGGLDDAASLAALAWDLGVDYALFPPVSWEVLPGVLSGLLGGGM